MHLIWEFLTGGFAPDHLLSPLYLVPAVGIALLVYLWRRETSGFWAWLLPRSIWTHRSTRADLELFLIGRGMAAVGLVGVFAGAPAIATLVAQALPWDSPLRLSPLALGFVMWVTSDFAFYLNHRLHHDLSPLWPLHAVHHSAEVLTPITAHRQHPLSLLIGAAIQAAVLGGILGLLVGAFSPETTVAQIAGVNAFTVAGFMALSNLHHSHIRISYGRVLEHLVISPAQHQVHHSTNPAHFNKNYGMSLAIWDWAFGTLYISRPEDPIVFGLTAKADAPLATHRLWPILIDPLRRMLRPRG